MLSVCWLVVASSRPPINVVAPSLGDQAPHPLEQHAASEQERVASNTATSSQKVAAVKASRPQRAPTASVAELSEQQASPTTSVTYVGLEQASRPRPEGSHASEPKKPSDLTSDMLEGTMRCGFSWDDAAAKCGLNCINACTSVDMDCYKNLPFCNNTKPAGECVAVHFGVTDTWCDAAANSVDTSVSVCEDCVDAFKQTFFDHCICEEVPTGTNTPIEPPLHVQNSSSMPERSSSMVDHAIKEGELAIGLPECSWKPGKGCSNETQYECLSGKKKGQCTGENWYYREDECSSSCVHVSLLNPPPYYAIWRYGPRALPWDSKDTLPRYSVKGSAVVREMAKQFDKPKGILMSTYCQSEQIAFVGVSFFSPNYEAKAYRLMESCNKLGVCCKATEMAADFLGADAPEGSDKFRFQMIALKPGFLYHELEATKQPVVFLDVDLEFHQVPRLFLPGSWPEGARDVALFNFWANETNLTYRHTPQVGSAVAFFNQTYRAKMLLTAWAEAMQYKTNKEAPDDQVLDKLLNEGKWMGRVSLGWLPASYLRLMPAYYRGVSPVIDHDRGTAPGVAGHSTVKPIMPKVEWWEHVDQKEIHRESNGMRPHRVDLREM
eukprot:scaffold41563_cov60-Phaeocystis_antarctica.AAC.1